MVQKFLKLVSRGWISWIPWPPRISTGRSCSRSISLDSCSPRNRRRRISLLPFSLLSSLSAPRLGPWRSRRNELIYILATPLLSALLLGAGERKHMCAVCRAPVCVGVGRTRKARPQRFKDSTPGAAGGNLNRNTLEQVLIRGFERIPSIFRRWDRVGPFESPIAAVSIAWKRL